MAKQDPGAPNDRPTEVVVPQQLMPASSTPRTDPYRGQGGSYVRDPATGQRRLIHRTKT